MKKIKIISFFEGGNIMKSKLVLAVFTVFLMSVFCANAFAFDSGSTGSLGALNPTTNTEIELPANGILNYTTVNIPQGVTVTFKKNSANTPVYMLATGDVTIAGVISVNGNAGVALMPGKGGPGGYDGGLGAAINYCGGTGLGFGGGQAAKQVATTMTYGAIGGGGSFGVAGSNGYTYNATYATGGTAGATYGNENLLPMIGGSGGGGGCGNTTYSSGGGGGGGGAIVIASSGTINVTGSITANGGNGASGGSGYVYGYGGSASGGAIKLIADIISGNGTISAAGGSVGYSGGGGGAGRIRLEANTLQRTSNTTPSYTFAGFPAGVFPSVMPTLKITKVGGLNVSSSPTGAYATPDVILPSNAANPVDIVVEATNIPTGTTVTITCVPETGTSKTATTTLSGTQDLSTGTAQITISNGSANVLMATATFTFEVAANQMPIYADGEKVVKMRIASVFGGASSVTYITETGKEVRANI